MYVLLLKKKKKSSLTFSSLPLLKQKKKGSTGTGSENHPHLKGVGKKRREKNVRAVARSHCDE